MIPSLPSLLARTTDRANTHTPHNPPRIRRVTVIGVHFPAHSLTVKSKGCGKMTVKAVESIAFGTPTTPLVNVGDEVDIEQQAITHRWLAIKWHRINRCATTPTPAVTGTDLVGFAFNPYGASFNPLLPPDAIFHPPIWNGGELSLPGEKFPITPTSGSTYDVGGGYAGTLPAESIAQAIGLYHGATWNGYFVEMTGSDDWTMAVNGTTIASGSGSGAGAFDPAVNFADHSLFLFTITGTGASSDLWYGAGP